MKVLFLPLDSRPITYELPYMLGKAAAFEVVRPDREMMDNYKRPSCHKQIKDWLLNSIRGCDRAIISVEQLVYGSLLESRNMGIDITEAIDRLNVIKELKKIEPDAYIVVTNTLMRSTISTLSSDDVKWWAKVAEYARCYTGDQNRAKKLEKEIPSHIIDQFVAVRQRNHRINLECIDLLKDNDIDQLVILQEDSSVEGIHRREQEVLLDKIRKHSLENRFQMMNGTDEIASTIMGSFVHNVSKVHVDWYHAEYEDYVCRFEDRPFRENVAEYLKLSGIKETALEDSEHVIAVYFPEDLKQGDYCSDEIAVNDQEELERYCDHLQKLIDQSRKVYLLDVYNCNGGSPDLLKMLLKKGIVDRLYGYSGWNTGANSLGTLSGELAIGRKCQDLFDYHLLDDMLYQAIVRKQLETELEHRGEDVWNLTDKDAVSDLLNEMMHEKEKEYGLAIRRKYQVSLYWPRIFECQIDFKEED